MENIKKKINNYYWEVLEEKSDGYGDPYPLEKIKEKFNITISWKQLHQIFVENGYRLK